MRDENRRDLTVENAELHRLLAKHEWSGLTPPYSEDACPECAGVKPPRGGGHRVGCALAAALAARTN